MPNYYAHLEYGRRVLDLLPPALRWSVEREKDSFEVGLYGPDPLQFYHPLTHNPVRQAGKNAHRQAARLPMVRLRQAMAERTPMALGYAAGLLCHYALDSACHEIIAAETQKGDLTHGAIESEFDRRLMVQKFLDPLRDTPMPDHELPESVYEAAACAYPGVSPRQFRAGLELFQKSGRLLTLASGTPLRALADHFAQRYPGLAHLRGVVLQKTADPACDRICKKLESVLNVSMLPAAQQLVGLMESAQDAPLSDWFNRDFSGQLPQKEPAQETNLLRKAPGVAG